MRKKQAGLRMVLLGPPGSGKGTLAQWIFEHLNVPHCSTGDLFRREIKRKTALGKRVASFVERGLLVPDELVVEVMTKQLRRPQFRNGFMLDGFPRTAGQAAGLDKFLQRSNIPLDGAVYLECTPSVLTTRLSGRLVCSRCGEIYHVRNMPPKRQGVCDRCKSRLVTRKDDQVSTIRKRLKVDHAKSKPLLGYYRRRRLLYPLNGDGSGERVFKRALQMFRREGLLANGR